MDFLQSTQNSYRLHIFHAFMQKKLSAFIEERIKFFDFYGWMLF